MTILVTGAAGNLGSRLVRHLQAGGRRVRAMIHRRPLPPDLRGVETVSADLARPETLPPAVAGAGAVVHFAGVLFRPRPERFLPETNTRWFANLLDAALAAGVGRVVLVSFPHVEGPTTPESPAAGRLDREPASVHARTRLEEERLLLGRAAGSATVPVVLRSATVYGPGIKMVEAARWLARRRLLGVWRRPTWYHFIHADDFARAAAAAATRPGVRGVYHAGDERPTTIQDFLDRACRVWGAPPPRRMPWWMIWTAAAACEAFATVFRTPSPLTRDFVRLGRVSHVCDTRRMHEDLLPDLRYPTLEDGLATLR